MEKENEMELGQFYQFVEITMRRKRLVEQRIAKNVTETISGKKQLTSGKVGSWQPFKDLQGVINWQPESQNKDDVKGDVEQDQHLLNV